MTDKLSGTGKIDANNFDSMILQTELIQTLFVQTLARACVKHNVRKEIFSKSTGTEFLKNPKKSSLLKLKITQLKIT
ncbi:MAG: hypothetical protein FWC12_12200 [Treponema sp.]|nr:hypothetical protein [Treponema sp.]